MIQKTFFTEYERIELMQVLMNKLKDYCSNSKNGGFCDSVGYDITVTTIHRLNSDKEFSLLQLCHCIKVVRKTENEPLFNKLMSQLLIMISELFEATQK